VSKFKDLQDSVAKKKRSKKAAKKKVSKKKAAKKPAGQERPGPGGLNATVPDNSREVAKIASEYEVRQFVRLFARAGWDILQATAQMHPELRAEELKPVAEAYRTSPHFPRAFEHILRETADRIILDQDSAEEILSRYATTSPLDFLADDGKVKPIGEMRRMPRHAQLALRKIRSSVRDIYDSEGNVIATKQDVEVQLHDPLKSIQYLARIRGWGMSEEEEDLAKLLVRANNRLNARTIDLDELDPED